MGTMLNIGYLFQAGKRGEIWTEWNGQYLNILIQANTTFFHWRPHNYDPMHYSYTYDLKRIHTCIHLFTLHSADPQWRPPPKCFPIIYNIVVLYLDTPRINNTLIYHSITLEEDLYLSDDSTAPDTPRPTLASKVEAPAAHVRSTPAQSTCRLSAKMKREREDEQRKRSRKWEVQHRKSRRPYIYTVCNLHVYFIHLHFCVN